MNLVRHWLSPRSNVSTADGAGFNIGVNTVNAYTVKEHDKV